MHMKPVRQGQFASETVNLVQKPEQGILGPRMLPHPPQAVNILLWIIFPAFD